MGRISHEFRADRIEQLQKYQTVEAHFDVSLIGTIGAITDRIMHAKMGFDGNPQDRVLIGLPPNPARSVYQNIDFGGHLLNVS
jgi:hypothetical protein